MSGAATWWIVILWSAAIAAVVVWVVWFTAAVRLRDAASTDEDEKV